MDFDWDNRLRKLPGVPVEWTELLNAGEGHSPVQLDPAADAAGSPDRDEALVVRPPHVVSVARCRATLLSVLLALPIALAQPPAAKPLLFTAATTEPTPVRGQVIGLAKDGSVKLGDLAQSIPEGALIALRRADRPLPPWPRGQQVILANGDRIAGAVAGGDAQVVRVRRDPSAAGEPEVWRVPLTALAAVWETPPPADTPADPAAYPWAAGPKRRDALLLRNGDTVRGAIESFTENPLTVRVRSDEDPVPTAFQFTGVSAMAFDPTLARVRKPKGPYGRLVLADGTRVSVTDATSDGVTLGATTLFGAALKVRLADVIAYDVVQGKAAYLSDLKPKTAKAEPFNSVAWPWASDRSAKGNPLRLGDHTFDKGLGTHPRTTLVYDLNGKYRRFEAIVGLDAVTGRRGTAEVRVLVDGKEVFVETVSGGEAAKPVSVDVAKAKQLTLIVGFGPGGDVQADVNWADARLVE
jgi:hypothetical protein